MSTTEDREPESTTEAPHQEAAEKPQYKRNKRISGTVKWYNAKDGFGFITRHDNGEDVFVHRTSILRSNRKHFTRSVGDGEEVEFGLIATKVTGPGGKPVQGSPFVAQRGQRGRRERRRSNSGRHEKRESKDERKRDIVGDGLQTNQTVKEVEERMQNVTLESEPPAEEPNPVNNESPEPTNSVPEEDGDDDSSTSSSD